MTTIKYEELNHYINGEFVQSSSDQYIDVTNPSTGEVIGKVPLANKEEVNRAVVQAHLAYKQWSNLSHGKRTEYVVKFRSLLNQNIENLVSLISKEGGKTRDDARGEIQRGIESVDLAINAPHLLKGEYSANVGGNINSYSTKTPLGVVVAISPFNFPVMIPLAITSMAVATGNAVILKPSEKVPLSTLFISKLWEEAGLPAGVWNVVNGGVDTVNELISHEKTKAILFVGSTPIAEKIYHKASALNKRVATFGGGKNSMIVMPDVDLEYVADSFIGAAYGASSQRCMALSNIIPVGEETAEALVALLKEKIAKLKIGLPEEDPDFGPVISQESKDNLLNYIDKGIEEGAKLVCDGRRHPITENSGFFLGPTLFDFVKPGMVIHDEEVFGPVRNVIRAATLDDAIKIINDHELGNGVAIFTNDGYSARKFTNEIEVGMVGINVPIPIPVGYFNFGGLKRSKFGDGHMFGPDLVRFFTKGKTISEKWIDSNENFSSKFSFPSN